MCRLTRIGKKKMTMTTGHHFLPKRPTKVKSLTLGFYGGPAVKSPPVNASDMGLIPGPGRSDML